MSVSLALQVEQEKQCTHQALLRAETTRGQEGDVTHHTHPSPPGVGALEGFSHRRATHGTEVSGPLTDLQSTLFINLSHHVVRTHNPSSAFVSHDCRLPLREDHRCLFNPCWWLMFSSPVRHPNGRYQIFTPTPPSPAPTAKL